jgi:hypothetical protein
MVHSSRFTALCLVACFAALGCGGAAESPARLAEAEAVPACEDGASCFVSYNCSEGGQVTSHTLYPGTCLDGSCQPTNYCNAPPETTECSYFMQYTDCGPPDPDTGICADQTTSLTTSSGQQVCCTYSTPVHPIATGTTPVTVTATDSATGT